MKRKNNRKKNIFVVLMTVFTLVTEQVFPASAMGTVQEDIRGVDKIEVSELAATEEETQEATDGDGDGATGQGTEESTGVDTADLRLVFTSDTHGQITTEDYENGTVFTTGGLSRSATLIKQAKSEVNENNTLVFDLGDNLYDYTTDYIYNYDDSASQPIFKALSMIGYDAMVLGNHDFEYTLSYIKKQLSDAGLTKKIILSNIKDINTGKTIWDENRIIEKELTTASGRKMKVKVGLIGVTVPVISNKRENYTGILQAEDIIQSVKKEVPILKSEGADVIVVLSHSGVGAENPVEMAVNSGYALTKIDGVDAVLCGHAHKDFPSANGTKYDYLPGIDFDTGLVNGKNLIQVKDRGASIGVADLYLSDEDDTITIVDRATSIRNVNAETEVDQEIEECMGDWRKIFLSDCSEILCEIGNDTKLQNYFGTQEDTDLIQLINNIKIGYGLSYINNTATQYKKYPVVGASSYIKYGFGDSKDYVNITGDFKRSNMYDLIDYKTGLYLYKMTGAQIKEWLEWSASCYETQGENLLSAHDFPNYSGNKPLQYALQEEYLSDWKNFYVFDGIEYKINPASKPRYDAKGKKINNTERITSLTRNGSPVADKDIFVVACHKLPDNTLFNGMNPTKIMSTSTDKYRSYIEEFIRKIALTGNLKPMKDNNWSVMYSDRYNYILRSGESAEDTLKKEGAISGAIGDDSTYWYYLLEPGKVSKEDKSGPGINVTILDENMMNKNGTIIVQATDLSGVASVKYAVGKYSINNEMWNTAKQITSGSFQYNRNAIYSILAEDTKGNRSIAYIKTSNIDTNVLAAPVVKTYTNRKKQIEGTAEAGSKIYFQIENGKIYSSTVTSKGTFQYALPPQKSGKRIFVYVIDSKGRTSPRTTVTVKRTGPNKPELNKTVKTNSKTISGKTNDVYAYPLVLVDDQIVYVQNSNVAALYKKSSFYNKTYEVAVTDMKIDSSGAFQFTLPDYPDSSMNVKLKTVDALARCSLQDITKVIQTAPRKPEVSQISNLSTSVKVYTKEECMSATVKIGSKKYTSSNPKYDSKARYYYTIAIPKSDSTSTFQIWITNKVGSSSSVTLHPIEKVPDKPKLNKVKRSAKKVTGKVHLVGAKTGENTVKNTKTKVYLYLNGKKYTAKVKDNGTFAVAFKKKKLKAHDKLVCVAKNCNGTSQKLSVSVK